MDYNEVPGRRDIKYWGEELTATKLDALAFLDPIPKNLEGSISKAIQDEMKTMAAEKDSDGTAALRDYRAFIEDKLNDIIGYKEAIDFVPTKLDINAEDIVPKNPHEIPKSNNINDYVVPQARILNDMEILSSVLSTSNGSKELYVKETFLANIDEERLMNEKLRNVKRQLDSDIEEVSKKRKLFQLQSFSLMK